MTTKKIQIDFPAELLDALSTTYQTISDLKKKPPCLNYTVKGNYRAPRQQKYWAWSGLSLYDMPA